MLKFLSLRLVLLVGFVLLSISQSGTALTSGGQKLISEELLEHANLRVVWEYKLPIREGENLKRLLILGNNIYAVLDSEYVVSLNRENGSRIFSRNISLEGLPIDKLQLYGDVLMSVGGSRIVEIDPRSGIGLKTINVGFSIVGTAARNDMFYYLGGIDKRLHAIRVSDRVNMFEAAADNESMITTILAEEVDGIPFVIFATDRGNIINMAPDQPRRRWQFNAAGAIAGPIVKDGRSLYFACEDTNVYRIDMVGLPERMRLIWKYQTNGMLNEAPSVTRDVIYQYVRDKGLTAIDKGGSFLWMVQGGIGLLAESNGKAYVITKDSKLVVMDNTNKKKLYSVSFTGMTKHVTNIVDSNIYVADTSGRITCLQPTQ